jgi:hypothetical protein
MSNRVVMSVVVGASATSMTCENLNLPPQDPICMVLL